MNRRAANSPSDLIIRRTLLTSEMVAGELRERLARELASGRLSLRSETELLDQARALLAEYEPILADLISNSDLYGWVAGYDQTAKKTPDWILDLLRRPGRPPGGPPRITLPGLLGEADEPVLRFPLLEKAFQSLLEREVVTRDQFDLLSTDARQRAFTIAGDLTEDTLETIRDVLAEDVQEGTSLKGFRARIEDRLEGSPIGPAHLETVYRTNVQAAFRDGRESLANNPIVRDVFPYQEYLPIGDARVREEHKALGALGLDGTGIYRRDDPFWDYWTPPVGFNCRCGVSLLTVEAAADRGVKEAQRWLETGIPPAIPEHRLPHIPFRPPAGFGSRGRATVGV